MEELTKLCVNCIEEWKKENGNKPLDIIWGDYANHCYQYGGAEIQYRYNELFADEENHQDELTQLERELLIANVGEKEGNRIYIGRRIAELRAEQGLTQMELANKCGLSQTHITRAENGMHSIQIDTIVTIISALGRRIDLC